MKHPDAALETVEFNLGRAPVLRCSDGTVPQCGQCEGCQLGGHLAATSTWLSRAGHQSRRRFLLGLVRRLHSVDLLHYTINLLRPTMYKDFTYARTRPTPSLPGDTATNSGDRALDVVDLETNLASVWLWFEAAPYWTKANFLLAVLQKCDPHELHLVAVHANTLLAPEQRAFTATDDYEAESVASTTHTFNSEDRPELELLTSTCAGYSPVTHDPFQAPPTEQQGEEPRAEPAWRAGPAATGGVSLLGDGEMVNEDSGEEDSLWGGEEEEDPTCLVLPGSVKAYSGVARYVDFMRRLPVHLSKQVLGFLDQVSLHNCVCVSRHWRMLAEQVHREYYVNQHLWEEVMLMQGAAAQGCNPVYAKDIDVAVPNLHLHSWDVVRTDGQHISPTYKSEVNMGTAYSGYSTRNIIMEERNVYCGAYNVMVLSDIQDPGRVLHTDDSPLITLGSSDRKVRFLHCEKAREVEPVITGHAGSVRCVALEHGRGFVLSGSYDTSIRKWSLETGKCQKILRGHRDTVQCLVVDKGLLASGAKDRMCKVWDLETAKCKWTFKHRHAVTAVALSQDMVISGCEGGRVKVWHLPSGQLIKRLSGHHGPVTAIKFDRWHIMTASKDGYALGWSSQGNHTRCLTALRHPKEVLSLEFLYLRVITGSADGKLRIWNFVTGQCLRIMRGNSRSDPITQLIAIDNRITINTVNNVLVLNFEAVEYDYTLESDKMAPLVQYGRFSDAPVRPQPYTYIRAQRMAKAGATNTKIVYHSGRSEPKVYYQGSQRPEQIPHSAKGLSQRSMDTAKRIQSACGRLEEAGSGKACLQGVKGDRPVGRDTHSAPHPTTGPPPRGSTAHSVRSVSVSGRPPRPAAAASSKSRHSASHFLASVAAFQLGTSAPQEQDSDLSQPDTSTANMKRRVSWAFEHPDVPSSKELSLPETKSLLRSQIRAPKDEITPPDFIYLTVNAIQSAMKSPTEASRNMEVQRREEELERWRKLGRPSSSPSRMDPRTKVPVKELQLDQLMILQGLAPPQDAKSEAGATESQATQSSNRAGLTKAGLHSPSPTLEPPKPLTIVTEFAPHKVETRPRVSLHSSRIKSSIPRPSLLRPHTACVLQKTPPSPGDRPDSALARPATSLSAIKPAPLHTRPTSGTSKDKAFSTSALETSHVPMLMYPSDMAHRLAGLRDRHADKHGDRAREVEACGDGGAAVSKHNHPLRSHVDFRLLTHAQEESQLKNILDTHEGRRLRKQAAIDTQHRKLWLAKVKAQSTGCNIAPQPAIHRDTVKASS